MKLTKEHLVDAITQTKQYHNEHEGGGSANIVELTQAEYDALPDTKLTDDVTYFIKDGEDVSSFVLGGAS